MLVAYWLGFRRSKVDKLIRTWRYTHPRWPLTRRQLETVVSSGSLPTRTGGCHSRGGGQGGLPPRTRAPRTSPRALAPWAPGSVSEADVFNPLIEFLEQGIIIRFLVIKDNLSWSTGWRKFFTDRLDTLLQFALVSAWYLGLKLRLVHYYISGSWFILNAIHWENSWCMRKWFKMQHFFR